MKREYKVVLQDLHTERAALDAAIATIEWLVQMEDARRGIRPFAVCGIPPKAKVTDKTVPTVPPVAMATPPCNPESPPPAYGTISASILSALEVGQGFSVSQVQQRLLQQGKALSSGQIYGVLYNARRRGRVTADETEDGETLYYAKIPE